MTAWPTAADVEAAAAGVRGSVARTPCTHSATLSAIVGAGLWCKWENLQYSASFKERGARWFLLGVEAARRARGVVAASAGNHAQGVARHARLLGAPATIVMPAATPFAKVTRTQMLGAEVILHGDDFSAAHAHAVALARRHDLVFVPPFDDPRVVAGQGTVALEILEQAPDVDTLVVPVGGGGLLAGCAIAADAARRSGRAVRVVGVQSETHPQFAAALGVAVDPVDAPSIAEGIAVKQPGELTVAIARDLVDEMLVVREETIEEAISLYLEIEKSVVEGAGAVTLAAALEHSSLRGRRCALVVSGGNIDLRVLSSVILRALARSGRLVRYRLEITDSPGRLAAVAQVIGAAGGNIVDVEHHRDRPGVPLREAVLEVSVETRDAAHAGAIERALGDMGVDVRRA